MSALPGRVKASINRFRTVGASAGVWIDRATTKQEVESFIDSVRPMDCGRRLIRIGPNNDGGYLVPDDLEAIVGCVSPGISTESGFELALADRGIPVHMADASVDGPAVEHPAFHFTKKFLDVIPSDTTITIDNFCADLLEGDLLLQMDIEGAEFRVLLNMSEALLKRFRIIVVEVHSMEQIFSRFGFGVISATLARLNQFHQVVHIHPNNVSTVAVGHGLSVPALMEFTFYRRDCATFSGSTAMYPHPLDSPNVVNRRDPPLPVCWR